MFPLKDDNPTQTKPIVTIALIAICIVYFYTNSLYYIQRILLLLIVLV